MPKMMIITRNFYPEPGAKARRLTLLCKYLKRNTNLMITVITTNPSYGGINTQNDNHLLVDKIIRVDHKHENSLSKRFILEQTLAEKLYRAAANELQSEQYDLVFVECPPFSFRKTIIKLRKIFSGRIITNISDSQYLVIRENLKNNIWMFLAAWYLKFIEKLTFVDSDIIITQTEPLSRYIFKSSGKNSYVFLNAVDQSMTEMTVRIQPKRDHLYCVYAGLLSRSYDFRSLIKSMKMYHTELKSRFSLDIYGYGFWKKIIMKSNIENIRFFPVFDFHEAGKIYSKYDCAIIPASNVYKYGIPVKMLESMAIGLPILYIGEGEGAEVIRESKCGMVAKHDPKHIFETILRMSSDVDLRIQMGKNAKNWISKNRIFQNEARKLVKFLSASTKKEILLKE